MLRPRVAWSRWHRLWSSRNPAKRRETRSRFHTVPLTVRVRPQNQIEPLPLVPWAWFHGVAFTPERCYGVPAVCARVALRGPREGGANPPRPRHCNRGRNPRVPLVFELGRRGE